MFYHLIKNSNSVSRFDVINSSYCRLTSKQVKNDKSGVLSRSFVFERFDNASILNKFHVDDFKLSNILALGAYDMLKPQVMSDVNPLTVINQVDREFVSGVNGITEKLKSQQNV